jgi:hypothetical protein
MCLVKYHALKTYGGVNLWCPTFVNVALVGDERLATRLCRFIPGKEPSVPLLYEAGWTPEPV